MIDNLIILCLGGIGVFAIFFVVGLIAEWKEWK